MRKTALSLRKGKDEKTEDSDSDTKEKLDFESENYWNEICHTTPEKVLFDSIHFKSLENSHLAMNHIIVCGFIPSLGRFIVPLRAKYQINMIPIVILHNTEPTDKEWSNVSHFPQIYFVKGSALNTRDLKRVNIDYAMKIIILVSSTPKQNNPPNKNTQKEEDFESKMNITKDEEDLLDARSILQYKTIRKFTNVEILTELGILYIYIYI